MTATQAEPRVYCPLCGRPARIEVVKTILDRDVPTLMCGCPRLMRAWEAALTPEQRRFYGRD